VHIDICKTDFMSTVSSYNKIWKLSTMGNLPEWEGFHMPSLYVKSCAVIWQLPEVDLFFHNKF